MAQSYLKSTYELLDSGKTVEQLESDPFFNSGEMATVDTGQIFNDWIVRRQNWERWHLVQGLNLFFLTTQKKHGWISALETLFDPIRWEEIEHILDENNIFVLINQWDIPRLKKKFIRAKDRGIITVSELSTINQVFNGS